MLERFTETQNWVVVFDRSYGRAWWKVFLHPRFQHVHCLRETADGRTLMVSSMAHVMCVREYPNSLFDIVQQELGQNPTAILQYLVHYGSSYKHAPIDFLTCVSVVKRLLGITTGVNTPKQLYHELIRAGATVIKPFTVT
jgi:hypothetical protein